MAQTGKKINELTAITTVSNETVLPAVYVSGGNASSTANKVSIEQISNKITEDISTVLEGKQDKLTAGNNITIESNVISATDTKYTAGTNITISEQNVISADVDALPSQTGQSGKFLTTNGTDASWAEVNIPNNVWTQDNLIAGTNISITQVPQPVIDANTVQLHHFNDSLKDEISENDLNVTLGTNTYNAGHFDKCIYPTTSGYNQFALQFTKMNTFALASQSFTVDFWLYATDFGYGAGIGFKDAYSGYIYVSTSGSNYILNIANDLAGTASNKILTISNISGQWVHIAYVNDASAHKGYAFLNGNLLESWSQTNTINTGFGFSGITKNSNIDELRVSNVARWTSDFTPYSEPYGPADGPAEYQINAIVPQGGSAPTLTWYTGNTGTTVTIADTTSASLVKVYKNGILLQPSEDYSISGTTLTLVSALESQDKITTEVFA